MACRNVRPLRLWLMETACGKKLLKAYGFFLAEDGSLWAAGTATNGVQGTNDGVDHKVLTRIGTDNDWADMACSRFWGYSAFAIKTNGTLWAWGENSAGQLGIGNTQAQTLPVQVGTDTDWKQVAAGVSSVLALKADGSLWGWGNGLGKGACDRVPGLCREEGRYIVGLG